MHCYVYIIQCIIINTNIQLYIQMYLVYQFPWVLKTSGDNRTSYLYIWFI